MNRGSQANPGHPAPEGHSFNEAPIHESGKLADAQEEGFVTYRFNEAPIHESGK